jgi:hypothetical protein
LKSLRVVHAALALVMASVSGAAAQGGVEPTTSQVKQAMGTEWTAQNLAPSGRPVLPIFEGWFDKPDGTYDLCFGYHNLNLRETLEIPLGPDNFIEPARFDGFQPTHFDPVPQNGSRRYWCTFTVNVPADFGDQRVVWTLRIRGQSYSVPGHITGRNYEMDEPDHATRSSRAPVIRFAADGEPGKGRSGLRTGPVTARVGEPLPLTLWVDPTPRPLSLVWWFKHQGPGEVTFSNPESEVRGAGETTTTATFALPGTYLLRVKAVPNISDISYHCCWSNGYVEVVVSP